MELLCVLFLLVPVVFLVCMVRNLPKRPAAVQKVEVRPREVARPVSPRCRAAAEALYLLHAPDIAARLPRDAFDAFVGRHLQGAVPDEEAIENMRSLQAVILQHLEHTRLDSEAAKPLPALPPPPPPSYANQLAALVRQHAERLAALRALSDTLDAATLDAIELDRIVEAEMTRFNNELLNAGQNAAT